MRVKFCKTVAPVMLGMGGAEGPCSVAPSAPGRQAPLFHDTSIKRAEFVLETKNRDVEMLIAALVAAGFPKQLLLSSADDQHAANTDTKLKLL